MNLVKRFMIDESGQGMVEYGVILTVVVVVAMFALTSLGEQIRETFNNIMEQLQNAGQ